jgi:hypothetical protein
MQMRDEYLNPSAGAMAQMQAGAAIGGHAAYHPGLSGPADTAQAKEAPLMRMGRIMDGVISLTMKLEERLCHKVDFLCGAVPSQADGGGPVPPPSLASGALEAVNEQLSRVASSLHRSHELLSRLDRTLGQ